MKEPVTSTEVKKVSIESVEFLRGVAALMVCWFHLTRGNTQYFDEGNWMKESGKWGWAGVEIFFVISGFIIPFSMYLKSYKISNFWIFLKKRIVRIEPPYLFSILLVILLNYVSTLSPYYGGQPFEFDIFNILSHLAYLNVFTKEAWLNPVYWTLAIELQYYLIIAVCFGLIVSKKIYYRILFFVIFSSLFFVPINDNSFLMSYTLYFMAGILLFQLYRNIGSLLEILTCLGITIILIFYSQGLIISSLVVFSLLSIWFMKTVPSYFKFLGMISYSLYLLHSPIGGRVINITKTFTSNIFYREIMVFVALGISIITAWIFYYFIERYFKKLSSLISYQSHH